jgi:NADH-quinone oxidoreductase subunit D
MKPIFEDQRETIYHVDPEHPENPSLPTLRTEEMMLNMGPQHPSTHGVLKVVLALEGERIVKATPVLGFLHRGVEKLAEDGTYHQFIPHTDRLDYICAMYNNFAYCRAVEKLVDIKVPPRAEYLRTIVAEIQRIIGHQFWLGTQALDIGAMTVFF